MRISFFTRMDLETSFQKHTRHIYS